MICIISDIKKIFRQQLALEYGCDEKAFSENGVSFTAPVCAEGRRIYRDGAYCFTMAAMGRGAVISAPVDLHESLAEIAGDKNGYELFAFPTLARIDALLYEKRGIHLADSSLMYMPETEIITPPPLAEIRVFERDEIDALYAHGFKNALCERFIPNRPDVLACAAMDGNKIAALAGCSADTSELWQIGIDVLPEYRGRGLGAFLVRTIKNETLRRGAIPFYATSEGNVFSQNISRVCGFVPAWTEIYSKEK